MLHLQFPYVTNAKASTSKTKALTQRSRRCPKELDTSHARVLVLTSCSDPNANGWSMEGLEQDLEQICWKENLGSHEPLCLYKRKPLLAS